MLEEIGVLREADDPGDLRAPDPTTPCRCQRCVGAAIQGGRPDPEDLPIVRVDSLRREGRIRPKPEMPTAVRIGGRARRAASGGSRDPERVGTKDLGRALLVEEVDLQDRESGRLQ